MTRFAEFTFDPNSGEISKNGTKLKIQGQPVEILALLLEHAGQVVSREEINRRLWPDGTIVEFEHSLNAAMARLREALGDDSEVPKYVETVPRRGYRFIGAVAGQTPEVPKRRSRSKIAVAAVVLIAALGVVMLNLGRLRDRMPGRSAHRITSIAVLPLENLSGDPQEDYFADGMTDELITAIGRIGGPHVISRTSVMAYKGTHKPLPEIARELGVDAVVEGSVLRSGDRVRIGARVIQARPEKQLWANSYESDLRDVLGLQREIALGVVGGIRSTLRPQDHAGLVATRKVQPAAHIAYLRGRYFMNRWPSSDFAKCEDYFNEATQKDPSFAEAHAALAFCYTVMSWSRPPKEVFPKAKAAALESLRLDNALAEGHVALGNAKMFYDWEWGDAERELKVALDLNPGNVLAHLLFSNLLLFRGHFEEAISEARRGVELDPASLLVNRNLTFVYLLARRYDDAIAQSQATLKIDPNHVVSQFDLARAYALKGAPQQALLEAKRFGFVKEPLFTAPAPHQDVLRLINHGLYVRMLASGQYVDPVFKCVVYAHLGDKEQAFNWLEQGYRDRSAMMVQLRVNPDFDPLRSDPRFQALLRGMNLAQ